MKTDSHQTRRHFLHTAALAASALPLGVAAAEAPSGPRGGTKVGCLSWCFHDLSPGADPEPAIDIIGELGFDGIELIVNAKADLQQFWTDARIDRLKQKLDHAKLRVSQFVLFQPVVEELSSTRKDEREQALDRFEAGCRIGRKFDAPIVNIVAPWARELKGPGGYLPRYYEIAKPAAGEKFHIDIAPDFDWNRVWDAYVETTQACLERAKTHGLKFTIEHHTHCLVPEAASFLRLWDRIRDPALGYNLDAGWTLLQREYPPVAIHKVRSHLMNLHMRDIDGEMRRFVHVGEGVMDFRAILDTLKLIGFDGFVSLEQDKHPGDMRETCRRYLRLMRELIG
jgi:sugar phosphate isomerase/epimerase